MEVLTILQFSPTRDLRCRLIRVAGRTVAAVCDRRRSLTSALIERRYSFRAEFFNLFNHPIIANPYGSANGSNLGDNPSNPGGFGGGGATPDVAAGNPLVGSGSNRVMQLG